MKKRWFGRLTRGIGWYPVTWQGWIILGIYIIFIVYDFTRIDSEQHSASDTLLLFIPHFLAATVILAFICYFTGEKPNT